MRTLMGLLSWGHIAPKIEVGQIWIDDDCVGNPFETKGHNKILDVKDGWVKYLNLGHGIEGTMKINQFRFITTLAK